MTPSPKCDTCGKEECEIHLDLHALPQACRAIFCHGHSEDKCKTCGGWGFVEKHIASCERDGCDGTCRRPCPSCKPEDKTEKCEFNSTYTAIECGHTRCRERWDSNPTPDARKGEEWEKEFDEVFLFEDGRVDCYSDPLKAFISRLLAEARREQHDMDKLAVKNRKDDGCLPIHEHGKDCNIWCRNMDAALSALDRVKPESRKE